MSVRSRISQLEADLAQAEAKAEAEKERANAAAAKLLERPPRPGPRSRDSGEHYSIATPERDQSPRSLSQGQEQSPRLAAGSRSQSDGLPIGADASILRALEATNSQQKACMASFSALEGKVDRSLFLAFRAVRGFRRANEPPEHARKQRNIPFKAKKEECPGG